MGQHNYNYAPTEHAIYKAIDERAGDPVWFQRLVERVAAVLHPETAERLVPFGRNAEGKPIPGWPDAYLPAGDGTIVAVEATTSKNAVEGHWSDDLKKFAARIEPHRRGGFVWACWRDPPPDPNRVATMYEEVAALGVPRTRIHLFFRGSLCHQLRNPRHARLWGEELALPSAGAPFSPITNVARLYGKSGRVTIVPTREEYQRGRVMAPRVLKDVERTLKDTGAALVSGHGASGKTTLAVLLAHRPTFLRHPVYYLDLSSTLEAGSNYEGMLAEALTACADEGVLFVVDNAHLAVETAGNLFRHWQNVGNGARLLILAREVRPHQSVWQSDPALADLGIVSYPLIVEAADLAGVYRRLVMRGRGTEPAPVPKAQLQAWHNLFGGDLVAFSAALLGRLHDPHWTFELGHEDARDYIRREYLTRVDFQAERESLLALAAVAEKELHLPIEAFADDALAAAIRRGLVWVETAGRSEQYTRLRLMHPGLATLLLGASGRAASASDTRCRLLAMHPFSGIAGALRLAKRGDAEEATAILRAVWAAHRWPLEAVPLSYWVTGTRLALGLRIVDEDGFRERLKVWGGEQANEALVARALATDLNFLANFLGFAKTAMPEVWTTLSEELAKEQHRKALVVRALATPLGDLANFLRYAEEAIPKVWDTLSEELAKEQHRKVLVVRALATPLGNLAKFLGFAKTAMPEVWTTLSEKLAKEQHRKALVARALATDLHFLANFLGFAKTAMPEVWITLSEKLAKEQHRKALVVRALATDLHFLANFLDFAKTAMPDVWTTLSEELAKEQHRKALVARALATPLGHLTNFLRYAEEAIPKVWDTLSKDLAKAEHCEALVARALATPLGHLLGFLRYADPEASEIAFLLSGSMPRILDLARLILGGLSRPPACEIFVEKALAARADELEGFFRYVAVKDDCLYAALRQARARAWH
jgi:hypothetical protein